MQQEPDPKEPEAPDEVVIDDPNGEPEKEPEAPAED